MPALNGPAFDRLKTKLEDWYVNYRQDLIAALEQDYPYGAIKLSPLESYNRFTQMAPQDYEALILRLNDKYRGLPNVYTLVNHDLSNYISHMLGIMIGAEGETPTEALPATEPLIRNTPLVARGR